jgi:hypothetical protein
MSGAEEQKGDRMTYSTPSPSLLLRGPERKQMILNKPSKQPGINKKSQLGDILFLFLTGSRFYLWDNVWLLEAASLSTVSGIIPTACSIVHSHNK